ncbi:MAG: hypothetical protein QM756_07530 [Polyangiaceae bacterium]
MQSLHAIGDRELLARTLALVGREQEVLADLIEHLGEIDQRRLYLDQACSSLFDYCHERLGFSEDEAVKRMRVARLAVRRPEVLAELRSGRIRLTGLFLLSRFAEVPNWEQVLTEARGKSRRELERLLAGYFPRADTPARVLELSGSRSGSEAGEGGAGEGRPEAKSEAEEGRPGANSETEREGSGPGTSELRDRARVEPLSASRYRVEFTASAELYDKMERASELMSHSVGRGDWAELFERALDCLLEVETKRRLGAGRPRARRILKVGSRHVPVEDLRAVWERDSGQCTFIDAEGRRCSARRLLTIEHRIPFALGGPSTRDNLCILCSSHNAHSARRVYGPEFITRKQRVQNARPAPAGVVSEHVPAVEAVRAALHRLGFGVRQVEQALVSSMPMCCSPDVKRCYGQHCFA